MFQGADGCAGRHLNGTGKTSCWRSYAGRAWFLPAPEGSSAMMALTSCDTAIQTFHRY